MERNITIEDKAKAYDEAIEVIRKCKTDKYGCVIGIKPSDIFPELKELEDEKIRKALLNEFIHLQSKGCKFAGLEGEKIVAWLEKQEQNKLIDKVEPKFKVGDWISNDYCAGKIIALTDDAYLLDSGQGIPFSCEHNAHFWTVEDAQDGDVLEFVDHERVVIGVVSFVNERTGKVDVSCLFENNKFKVGNFYALDTINPHPATKEQRELLFQKMKEAGYEWDEIKKKLKKIEDEPNVCEGCNNAKGCVACVDGSDWAHIEEQDPAWSEEKPTQEIEPFGAEHGKYYYCIKDYFCGGKKQASKGDVVQALRGLPIMGLKDASEYFLPVNSIKCNSTWSEEDDAIYDGIIETELYMLDVVNGIKKFDVGNVSIKEECTRELNWLRSFYNDLIKNYRDYENKEI